MQLHQTVALIDSVNFLKNIDNLEIQKDEDNTNDKPLNELLLRQLVHADKILINKCDRLEEETKATSLSEIEKCIKHVNKRALQVQTEYAKVDLDFLFDKKLDSQNDSELMREKVHNNHALSHKIIDQIQSLYIKFDKGQKLNKTKLEMYIGELLWEGPTSLNIHVMRCKGIFRDSEGG